MMAVVQQAVSSCSLQYEGTQLFGCPQQEEISDVHTHTHIHFFIYLFIKPAPSPESGI
jgi:hypothetical protein